MQTPLMGFNAARSTIVDEVVKRVCESARDPLFALNDAAYHEIRRLSASGGGDELAEWRALAHSLGRWTTDQQRGRLEELARRHAWDVAGNFDPRVYKVVSRATVPVLGALLNPRTAIRQLAHVGDLSALDGRILVEGPVSHIRALSRIGTLVFVPTHLSNLDSVVFGFALERSQLPPATYGAGKNLFTNPVLSFFMHNLGAYRVDRRLKHALYKDVLKTYSCVLLERGYHSLFFPGGTRSRSGGVERKLKLGLAGTGIEAFARSAERGRLQPVFFIPATINYLLTLEAETLIDDFLQEEGKSRYIIDDDESTRLGRIAAFMQKLLKMDASCVIRFSRPMDCFGNTVDELGRSVDARGRGVDAKTYVYDANDRPLHDPARDAEYTRELGEAICEAYKRDTVVMATHLVAAVAFEKLRSISGKADIFALLRHKDDVVVPREEMARDLDKLLAEVQKMADRSEIVLAPTVRGADGEAILAEALRAFSGYHANEVITPRGSDLVLADTRLLFYYQNRLAAHGLAADLIAPSGVSPSATRKAAAIA
ncbi:1-acyl-sn-glycerol-3-phosphate acyltransferase [Pendulispora albinea]|uniref:Glycerol-3-phosphate acyltransferase n=1 Tax=Pendulispora albinea TaxID=2741071 RepID=A0ABZ2LSE9_9BACT